MSQEDEIISPDPDLPVTEQSTDFPVVELRRFSPDEMVRCDECLRANPPTRVECLYCGQALALDEATRAQARPALRPLEKWEEGYNNILIQSPDENWPNKAIVAAAGLLRLGVDELGRLVRASKPLPLARTSTHSEALIIQQSLGEFGLKTMIVSDQDLTLVAWPPRRVRSLDLREATLQVQQTSGSDAVLDWSAITLLVTGRLLARQLEVRERKRRGVSEREILDSSETSTDESVLDIYTHNREGCWRIMANNFDFSCLGSRKTLLANENFTILVGVIRERATGAQVDDSYNGLRRILEVVWASEQQTESRGWQRGRTGKYSTSEVTITNNEPQFNRYSRLGHFLKLASPDHF